MPNQSHSGWTGVPWHRCDRCGYDYPVDRLRRQSGLILCVDKCIDTFNTISVDRRPAMIAAVLSTPGEEPELADILKNTDSDIPDLSG